MGMVQNVSDLQKERIMIVAASTVKRPKVRRGRVVVIDANSTVASVRLPLWVDLTRRQRA